MEDADLPPQRSWGTPETLWYTLALLGKRPLWSPDYGQDSSLVRRIRFAPGKIDLLEVSLSPTGSHVEYRTIDPPRAVGFKFAAVGLKIQATTLESKWCEPIRMAIDRLREGAGSDAYASEDQCLEVAGRYWHRLLVDREDDAVIRASELLDQLESHLRESPRG